MSGRGCEGRLCCKRELYCPPSHDRITRQRAHRCPPGPVSRPAGTPPRPAPPTDLPQQPSSPLRAPTSSQTRAESATIWGEKPRARHLRSVPAQLCGIRGGRAAPHMHPQAPGPWRWQQGPRATRTSPNALAQPAPACPNSLPLRAAQIAAAPRCRPIPAPRRGPPRPYTHPASARPLRRPGEAVAAPGQRLSLTPVTLNRRFCSPTPPKARRGARMLEHSRPVRAAGRVPRGCAGVCGTRRGGGGRQGGCHRET